MEFLKWWFDTHYILATIISPFGSLLWAIYFDLAVRAVASVCVYIAWIVGSTLLKVANK